MARAHARPLIGKTTNRASTSSRKDSKLMSMRMRPLLTSVANSNKVISEIAKPSAFLRTLIDRGPGLLGEWILVKRQPDNDMRIAENHSSSPHSPGEPAGETTSPAITPSPAREL